MWYAHDMNKLHAICYIYMAYICQQYMCHVRGVYYLFSCIHAHTEYGVCMCVHVYGVYTVYVYM